MSGNLILTGYAGPWYKALFYAPFSLLVSCCTCSKWSHVAMIIENPSRAFRTHFDLAFDELLFVTDFYLDGLTVHSHKKYIEDLKENGYMYKELHLDRKQRDAQIADKIEEFYMEVDENQTKYERHISELIASVGKCNRTDNEEMLFCTECCALALRRAGCLPKDIPANNYVPVDFTKMNDLYS